MADYRYNARDANGKSQRGVISAESLDEVERFLRDQRLFLIDAKEAGSAQVGSGRKIRGGKGVSLSRRRLIDFTIELESTYSAGISILQALEDFAREDDDEAMSDMLLSVAQRIKEGSSLSEAMQAYPRSFPKLYTALIAAGERTGTLDKVLNNLVTFLEWQDDLISQARQATIYPAAILFAVLGLIILLVTYVIPKFYQVFESLRIQLPWPTRMLLAISHFFQDYAVELVAGTILVIGSVVLANRTAAGRYWLDSFKLVLPIYGPLYRKLLLSRISHNLSMMLGCGIEVSQAFIMTEQLLGNVVMSAVVSSAREKIVSGGMMSEALGNSPFVPRSIVRKLAVGESTGRMTTSLDLIAAQYDKEIPRAIKRFFALLEPAMLVVLGGVVGFVALALFMPLYQLQDAISR